MLRKSLLVCVFLIVGAHCDFYSDSLEQFRNAYSWMHPRNADSSEGELFEEREREPLAPDYKDPIPLGTNQKPVLTPRQHPTTSTFSPILPDGIISINAGGIGQEPQEDPFVDLPVSVPDFDLPNFNLYQRPGWFSFGGFFGNNEKQWWKGENVCVEREESTSEDQDDDDDDEDASDEEESDSKVNKTETKPKISLNNFFSTSIRLSNCQETPHKYECVTKIDNHGVVKTFTVRYKCCYGFKRVGAATGCEKIAELKPILETLDDLKLKEFRNIIWAAGLEERFQNETVSFFAPTDEALQEYNEKMNEMNKVDPARRRRAINSLSSKELALSHAVPRFVDLTDLVNEEIIFSENDNSSIRINIYPTQTYERTLTVNCAKVKKGNNFAKNGIVHVMDGVVQPASQTIREIIESNPNLQHLSRVLQHTDIYSHMKPTGHYTFFAPTNDAFNKLDETVRQKILNGGGCASNILKHHITAHTVCSAAIIGNSTTHNVEGDILDMERTSEDKLIFEGKAQIIEKDIIATDGVIHLIDTIIFPTSAMYVEDVLKNPKLSKFNEIVQKSGLLEEIGDWNNVTLFAPFDIAFESPEGKKLLESIGDDKEKLQELVKYHSVNGEMQSCNMSDNQRLATQSSGKELLINLHTTYPFSTYQQTTVNCALMTSANGKVCGSTVYEVNKILVPPKTTIYGLLQDDPKYSTVLEIMKGTEVEQILQEQNRTITFLAPTDETFAAVNEDFKNNLLKNKTEANEVLKNHILPEALCCSGVPYFWGIHSFYSTLSGQSVEVARVGNQVRINRAIVTSCDNLGTNGVLQTINKVLVPYKLQNAFAGGFIHFDF